MTITQPIKLSQRYGRLMMSALSKKNSAIIRTCVINAAVNTAFRFMCFKKKANKNIPNIGSSSGIDGTGFPLNSQSMQK